jgi:ATPase subunit of ABC transporter with duplicated ATPase domains
MWKGPRDSTWGAWRRARIHGLLGQMLFSGEEGLKPTDALSGGETARLLFCRIMLQKPNVLVLDEPTNHLDLESINALNVALQRFDGTVLLVTHDQDVMEEVGTGSGTSSAGAFATSRARTRSTRPPRSSSPAYWMIGVAAGPMPLYTNF